MTKNIKPFFLIIPLLLIFSCNDYDDNLVITPTNTTPNNPPETPLTNGTWKKERYDTYHYENGILDNISTNTINADVEELDFNTDQTVIYKKPEFTNPIHGMWNIHGNNERLITNLQVSLSPATGYGTIFFFSNSKIIEIAENRLELESDTLYHTYTNGSEITYSKEFKKYYFHH